MAGGGPNAVQHNLFHKNAYFTYWYPHNETFVSVDGNDLGQMIDNDELESVLFFDSGPLGTAFNRVVDYYFAPAYNDDGSPLVVFNYNRTLLSAYWSGTKWELSTIMNDAALNLFDIEKKGPNEFRLLHAQSNILVFETHDGGRTWMQKVMVTSADGGTVSKVIKIDEPYHADLQYLALENNFTETEELRYVGSYKIWAVKEVVCTTIRCLTNA
jgi:hypothetical protein